ncbi:uncharacterized protein STEHIDRAFT_135196 [Stereum hirsutum FP-91666 SS1]|uniref:uncharacterized protein n=1 Tax=Stereum hirsutum (strain FP-91666) TaxID=721885 RepID=UPI0004449203|nr:uncharacterized protein STEHIDRAFT_135196 [Stereum hirsutum FP-91666 SS1]EIM80899.1 hypothetical protein STEHIDRAFT_135196 [Stereum hirsutum FP-91666 SS1]
MPSGRRHRKTKKVAVTDPKWERKPNKRLIRIREPSEEPEDTRPSKKVKRESRPEPIANSDNEKASEVSRPNSLSTIPMELFRQIASYVRPRDLLSLSKTNKALHLLLWSRSSQSIWKDIWSNHPVELRDCPEDYPEPAWINLLMGNTCWVCGAKDAKRVDFNVRRQTCLYPSKCVTAGLVQKKEALKMGIEEDWLCSAIVHTAWRDPATATSHWGFTPYWNPKDIRSLQAELKTFEENMEKEGLTEEMKAKAREQLREEKHWYRYERDRLAGYETSWYNGEYGGQPGDGLLYDLSPRPSHLFRAQG